MDKSGTLLIASSDGISVNTLSKQLSAHYDLLGADCTDNCWKMICDKQNELSAVLIDALGDMLQAKELLRRISSTHLENLPVLVIIGGYDRSDVQSLLDLGAWEFVVRPYSEAILCRRLENIIMRSKIHEYEQDRRELQHDSLTGLCNRESYYQRTREMINSHRGERFIFVQIDIIKFSLFNSSFGPAEGDRLLRFIAGCIRDIAERHSSGTYGRLYGDVFFISMPFGCTFKSLSAKVDHLQQRLSTYRRDYRLDVAVGVFITEDSTLSVHECCCRAGIAASKCKGVNIKHLAYYDEEAANRLSDEREMENEMQTALDNGCFEVLYKPQFRVSDNSVNGAKAFVQWRHAEKGNIMPEKFIPLFERNGFILKLDCFVLEETCRKLSEWYNTGREDIPVTVKLSRISLNNPQLVPFLDGLIRKYCIPAGLLMLELSQESFLSNPQYIGDTLTRLRESGFSIAIERPENGYPSVLLTKSSSIDALSIDMSGFPTDDERGLSEIIITGLIEMTERLGIRVIVDGVNNEKQLELIKKLNCVSAQGELFSEPVCERKYELEFLPWKKREPSGNPEGR